MMSFIPSGTVCFRLAKVLGGEDARVALLEIVLPRLGARLGVEGRQLLALPEEGEASGDAAENSRLVLRLPERLPIRDAHALEALAGDRQQDG
jgi:hypothetical protein